MGETSAFVGGSVTWCGASALLRSRGKLGQTLVSGWSHIGGSSNSFRACPRHRFVDREETECWRWRWAPAPTCRTDALKCCEGELITTPPRRPQTRPSPFCKHSRQCCFRRKMGLVAQRGACSDRAVARLEGPWGLQSGQVWQSVAELANLAELGLVLVLGLSRSHMKLGHQRPAPALRPILGGSVPCPNRFRTPQMQQAFFVRAG